MVCQKLDQDCQRVKDELALVGLQVHIHQGDQETVTAEMAAPWDAIVLVSDDGSHFIWARHGKDASTVESVQVQPAPGESNDSVALRSAELVRGELLPQNIKAAPEQSTAAAPSILGPRPPWAIATGPTLFVSSYGGVAIGWTADLSYWLKDFALGLFATGALAPSPWVAAAKEMNQQQLTAGILSKGLLLRTLNDRFDLMLGGGLGARTQWLSSLPPPGPMDEERFHGVAMALALQLQLEASYSFYPWLALGGALGATLGIPLSYPEPTAALKKKAADALKKANEQKTPDGLFQASVLVTFRF